MAPKILPDQAYLRECFDYDPAVGLLIWRERPLTHFANEWARKVWNSNFSGKLAGARGTKGIKAYISYRGYYIHRIIWKWMTGEEPPVTGDHKNRDPFDNTWRNLRLAGYDQQAWNTRNRRTHSLPKGVSLKRDGRYSARIMARGKCYHIGYFSTAEEAHSAYVDKSHELHGEFSNW